MPWIEQGLRIPPYPDDGLAKTIAACCVRLPAFFGKEWIVDKAIKELEEVMEHEGLNETWSNSRWLRGVLCLIVDDDLKTNLCGRSLKYDRVLGLVYKKGDQ